MSVVLTPEQIARYREEGVLVVDKAVTASQLERMRDEISGWVEQSRRFDHPFGPPTIDGRPRFDLGAGHRPDAPALRRVVESKSSRIPKADFDEAMAAIAEAIALTAERNEAAHGWLELADGKFRFFVPKIDGGPKLICGARDIEWLTGVAKRIRAATDRSHAAMEAIAKRHVF